MPAAYAAGFVLANIGILSFRKPAAEHSASVFGFKGQFAAVVVDQFTYDAQSVSMACTFRGEAGQKDALFVLGGNGRSVIFN